MKIIKSFFSFYNKKLERKLRTKRLLFRWRRLSSNRIYLSNGEFKHKNNNVLINIYLFNRQKHNYLYKLKNRYHFKKTIIYKNKKRKIKKIQIDFVKGYVKALNLINKKGLIWFKKVNKNKYLLINALNIIENNKNYKISIIKSLYNYTILFYLKMLRLTVRKLRLYFMYKQLIYLNKSKFNYNYLHILKKHLESIYNKNVEFNFINLKRFYLNSDIFSESIKLKLIRNKRKMRKILNKVWRKVKLPKKQFFLGFKSKKWKIKKKVKPILVKKSRLLRRIVIRNINYKRTTGFRLELKGRLSRRYTASRSVSKLKYKGNLWNLNSSLGELSSVILKGNLRPNLQYTKLKAKTKIGSFGLKGWISGN